MLLWLCFSILSIISIPYYFVHFEMATADQVFISHVDFYMNIYELLVLIFKTKIQLVVMCFLW